MGTVPSSLSTMPTKPAKNVQPAVLKNSAPAADEDDDVVVGMGYVNKFAIGFFGGLIAGYLARYVMVWLCFIVIIAFAMHQYYAMKVGVGMTGAQKFQMKVGLGLLDQNGDGKVDLADAMSVFEDVKPKAQALVAYMLPSGASFIGGFCTAFFVGC